MGKQGPCCHCGVASTPLWRNGPPEKPVLCNACGSRWRTKGTLANYVPLQARADPNGYEDRRFSGAKSISVNKNKEMKLLKRKQSHDNGFVGGITPDYNLGYRKVLDEDTSNRSSSGSAISNFESSEQFGSAEASNLTGPSQSNAWDTTVPSRKRTCVDHPQQSPVEKLTKDLYTILHQQQSSCFSRMSDEDLLFESGTPMVSVEIGHGSVLIRHPSSIARDEESEASSLSIENKQFSLNEAYTHSLSHLVHNENENVNTSFLTIEKDENPIGQGMQWDQLKRDNSHEKVQVLGNHNSPLCNVDLNIIINFKEFVRNLTNEEQQQLLKYLPLIDTAKLPNSLEEMFDSAQFKENVSCYQQLLAEGVFDLSFSGAKTEDVKTLKRLALSNLSKFRWVEQYNQLKSFCLLQKCGNGLVTSSNDLVSLKRPCESQSQKFLPELSMTKSPKRVGTEAANEHKELIDNNDGLCFSPRSLFALPTDNDSPMLDSFSFVNQSSDRGMPLDVPSNGSFAQAEHLHPNISYTQQASTSISSTHPHLLCR